MLTHKVIGPRFVLWSITASTLRPVVIRPGSISVSPPPSLLDGSGDVARYLGIEGQVVTEDGFLGGNARAQARGLAGRVLEVGGGASVPRDAEAQTRGSPERPRRRLVLTEPRARSTRWRKTVRAPGSADRGGKRWKRSRSPSFECAVSSRVGVRKTG